MSEDNAEPRDPWAFAAALAAAIEELVADPDRARALGQEGRRIAIEKFSWRAIALTTVELYESLLA